MLVDEDGVSIRVHSDEAGRPCCALVCLLLQLHPLGLQLAPQIADVGERGELLGVAVPTGVEGENVTVSAFSVCLTGGGSAASDGPKARNESAAPAG